MNLASKDGVINVEGHRVRILDPRETAGSGLSYELWLIGGLLVGLGTKMGNGCTSGHGVCGLPRFRYRSFVAVIIFMATCAMTATYKSQHPEVFKGEEISFSNNFIATHTIGVKVIVHVVMALLAINLVASFVKFSFSELTETFISLFVGLLFGTGLAVSGMLRRSKVYGFFTLNDQWDPSLACVMGGACLVNLFTFNFSKFCIGKGIFNGVSLAEVQGAVDLKVIVGPAIFGVGWGLTGMCPGPALINVLFMPQAIVFVIAVTAGQLSWEFVENFFALCPRKDNKPVQAPSPAKASTSTSTKKKKD